VAELAFDDCVVVRDQVVDITSNVNMTAALCWLLRG